MCRSIAEGGRRCPKRKLTGAEEILKMEAQLRRIKIAHAKKTGITEELQMMLASDPDPLVRLELSQNPTISATVCELLSRDDSTAVRSNIAGHKNTPTEVLRQMCVEVTAEVERVRRLNVAIENIRREAAGQLKETPEFAMGWLNSLSALLNSGVEEDSPFTVTALPELVMT